MPDPVVNLPGEEWKPLDGWANYRISNHGRIASVKYNRLMRPDIVRRGYLSVRLCDGVRRRRRVGVHRLVLEAFVGKPLAGMQCCHNDGNPANNHLDNLRWDTCKNNHADRAKHGTLNRGNQNGMAKLTADAVQTIRRRYAGNSYQLAREFGVSQSTIMLVVKRRIWAWTA